MVEMTRICIMIDDVLEKWVTGCQQRGQQVSGEQGQEETQAQNVLRSRWETLTNMYLEPKFT